jgi:hypothetical protein
MHCAQNNCLAILSNQPRPWTIQCLSSVKEEKERSDRVERLGSKEIKMASEVK